MKNKTFLAFKKKEKFGLEKFQKLSYGLFSCTQPLMQLDKLILNNIFMYTASHAVR